MGEGYQRAGPAYPESGEGIRPAIESGIFAAKRISECDGDYSRTSLQPYADRLVKRFGKPNLGGVGAGLMPAGLKQLLASKLLSTKWFARNVVVRRWFLHQHESPPSA